MVEWHVGLEWHVDHVDHTKELFKHPNAQLNVGLEWHVGYTKELFKHPNVSWSSFQHELTILNVGLEWHVDHQPNHGRT